jgi:superfamily I DNA/RNA helicase
LDEVALLSDPNELSNSDHERVGSKVKIMTIHAAKGSEFDVVFLAGMEEELLPHHYALMEDDVDEERRLCYVALTRAKRRVCVTFTKERVLWGQRRSVQPSQFLRDIDGSDVQWISHILFSFFVFKCYFIILSSVTTLYRFIFIFIFIYFDLDNLKKAVACDFMFFAV